MKRIKGISIFLMAVFLGAVLAVYAQDSETPAETSTATQKDGAPAETKAPVKKAKKAVKKKKKPAPKPVSEYKFSQISTVPTYKFDKQTNPIIKAGPKKKTAKKAAAKKAAAPKAAPKLKKEPAIDGSGEVKQGELPAEPPQQPAGD